MKRTFLLIMCLVVCLLTLSCCSKGQDPTVPELPPYIDDGEDTEKEEDQTNKDDEETEQGSGTGGLTPVPPITNGGDFELK